MTDLLIYVDNTTSCSVFFNSEERDVTLETFWRDIIIEQVHDVLGFPYKFTRLIRSERVVVGAKQESVIKLSQCLLGNTEPILFLVSWKKRLSFQSQSWRKKTEKKNRKTSLPNLRNLSMVNHSQKLQRLRVGRQSQILQVLRETRIQKQLHSFILLPEPEKSRFTANKKSRTPVKWWNCTESSGIIKQKRFAVVKLLNSFYQGKSKVL